MGFQDNSGDIIFDVVLTDEGRRQLAKGDGSFSISKFKLGDDEVNYELFDTTTGSAYQDLQILQTPIFESFANNTSNMSSMLVNYTNNNLLYLPVIKLNEVFEGTRTKQHALGNFVVAVDKRTEGTLDVNNNSTAIALDSNGQPNQGFLFGATPRREGTTYIRVDAGIDNNARPPNSSTPLESDLNETGYLVELDYRLGRLCDRMGNARSPLYVDDDNIAVYRLTMQVGLGRGIVQGTMGSTQMVMNNTETEVSDNQVIAGLRSTFLQLKIVTTQELRQSSFYFDKFGSTSTAYTAKGGSTPSVKFIDTLMKITGINTGYTLEVPIRFAKLA